MTIYIGADHRGFALKESLKKDLLSRGYDVVDTGSAEYDEKDDFPLVAGRLAETMKRNIDNGRGVIICGSGAGVDITINKFDGLRSVLGISPDQVYQSRRDDDVNVLSIASDYTDDEAAKKMTSVFLSTPFSPDEKHRRRLGEIGEIEQKN